MAAGVNRGILQGRSWFGRLSAVITVEAAARVVLAGALILAGFGATGALSAVSIAMLLGYGLGIIPLRQLIRGGSSEPVPTTHITAFVLPAIAAVGGITFLYNADIVLVRHFLSDRAGVYASAATVGRIVYFGTLSITGVMFPRVSAQVARGDSGARSLRLSAAAMCAVTAPLVAGLALLPHLALLPFGSGFHAAAPYLPALGLAMALLSLSNLFVNYLLASGDRAFVYVLAGGCIAEVAGIFCFHQSLWQVVWTVLAVQALTMAGLLGELVRSQRPVILPGSVDGAPG
jgi:O-antigen/teichoic acid export membrane protein